MLILHKRLLAWTPPLLWLLFITIISVLPSVQLPKFDLFATDKLGHALAYAGLTGLLLLTLARLHVQAPNLRTCLLVFIFAAAYGALMEFIQGTFLPNRAFEFDDMLANTFGAAVGWGLFRLFFHRRYNV